MASIIFMSMPSSQPDRPWNCPHDRRSIVSRAVDE
jgi:hypothetical protein